MVLTLMQHMLLVMDMAHLAMAGMDTAHLAMAGMDTADTDTADTDTAMVDMEWDTLPDMDGTTAQITHITLLLLGEHLTMELDLDGGALISNIRLLKFTTSLLMKLIIQFSLAAISVQIMSEVASLRA